MRIRKCYLSIFFTFVILVSLGSCHYGDPNEMRPSFADVKRNVEFAFTVGFPYAGIDDYSIYDYEIEGLNINWNESESLAVFGNSFVVESDTLRGDAAYPKAIQLKYDARRDGAAGSVDDVKTLDFSFSAWVKHGEGEAYAQAMPVFYPYSRILDSEGIAPRANVEELSFDFNGQDGLLQHLRDNYFIALSNGQGIIQNGKGVITDKNEYLKLNPKFAIVRLALTIPAEKDYTLNEYIENRSVSESVRYIDNITLSNQNSDSPGFNKTVLNLKTGIMEPSLNAQNFLIIKSNNAFTTLTDCPFDNCYSLESIGCNAPCWGTYLYLAIPCTDQGHLNFDALIDIRVVGRNTNLTEHYYGQLKPVSLEEGCYYVTPAIHLYPSQEDIEEVAELVKRS